MNPARHDGDDAVGPFSNFLLFYLHVLRIKWGVSFRNIQLKGFKPFRHARLMAHMVYTIGPLVLSLSLTLETGLNARPRVG